MAAIDALDSFTQYPLQMDPSSKAISLATTSGQTPSQTKSLQEELQSLNTLHRSLISLDPPNIPPPPLPINPKRSAQITKLRDTANTAYRKGNYGEAIKLYSLSIDMAMGRPGWEPVSLVRDELSGLFANRAQAHMAEQKWPEGWVDAKSSVECKPIANAKGWWRGGKCLSEMGRWEEAKEWVERALEIEGKNGESGKELVALMVDIDDALKRVA
ncbi:hypothetical protein DTO164E3_476 [Paecilomyces variotii]|uniref:Uncharacterized protein n=1 Tax=Byssochlamys spectabilis TaxID=264951 RepID=A0A443I898_BYSSP|nr:hypothetical protein C8Q69DRAFT_454491 [Paecilomyces variotii]KAJ9206370.1 hypothetical protein DTO032I3_1800 [Paecilomyces variotii]KAJ9207202.1 hypothetical protein DTO164E3_476 [Paecilomyces variotii]KAJ9240324.1 hypothetical protein DTO169E5_4112 [Paecilomyces variotii]KAJ9271190.1 hypothetical protein DTO212C5_2848 [Paecilomyces variotii]KAJ9281038.1 hypothetical protein DTO021D3_2092 [Paecilomyces variotii]